MDAEDLDIVAEVYELMVEAVVHRAEAAKATENTQRDINIAFMNELSIIVQRFWTSTTSQPGAA